MNIAHAALKSSRPYYTHGYYTTHDGSYFKGMCDALRESLWARITTAQKREMPVVAALGPE